VPHRPIVGVIDDDYLAVTRRPEDVAVEVGKKLSGGFLIVRSVNKALPYSNTDEQRWCDETSDGDPGGGGDPDDTGGGVCATSGKGVPSAEGERSCLMSFLSSIGG
jgi:hypothetical protein